MTASQPKPNVLATTPLKLASPTQKSGAAFEAIACQFLQDNGLTLITQNWQQPKVGEIDLIMQDQSLAWPTLIFVEVRKRRASNFGNAALSVSPAKQKKLIKTARYFLQSQPKFVNFDCRFDVVTFDGQDMTPNWIVAAFLAEAY